MGNRFRRVKSDESGFTLIELLVVILIIGILAAIAIPSFLGQQEKGQDADAKSNARNLVSQVEACFTAEQDYQQCTAPANTNLPMGTGTGQVSASASSAGTYTVTAISKASHNFLISKTSGGVAVRTCTPVGQGSCPPSGTW